MRISTASSGVASQRRQLAGIAGDDAAPHQEAQQRLRIAGGELVADIDMAAAFHRRRHDGVGDRAVVAEQGAELRPNIAEHLVERLAAGIDGEQGCDAAELGREIGAVGPARRPEIKMHQRIVGGMQIEHDIGRERA